MWLAQDEVTAAQAAPHFAQPGLAAEPVGECLLIGRIGDVSCEPTGDQFPSVDPAIFAHGRSFNADGEPCKRARRSQKRALLRGRWAVELAAPSRAASSAMGISSM